MYIKPLLAALTAATSATAAVLPRQTPVPSHGAPSGTYNITNFQVDLPVGSIYAHYTLQVTDPLNPLTPPSNVSTTCTFTQGTITVIAGFENQSCDDPSVTWSFVVGEDDFTLEVKHNWGETVQHAIVTAYDNVTDTATATFPKSDLVNNPHAYPGSYYPYLNASSEFALEYYRYIA